MKMKNAKIWAAMSITASLLFLGNIPAAEFSDDGSGVIQQFLNKYEYQKVFILYLHFVCCILACLFVYYTKSR